MLSMTCAIQTHDVETAAGFLLLFCVLIPIFSTCQLCLVTGSVPVCAWTPCDKNYSQRSQMIPLLWHGRPAWRAFQCPPKWQMSDKHSFEKASLYLPEFWGCRISVVSLVSLSSLERSPCFSRMHSHKLSKKDSGLWLSRAFSSCCG